MPALSASDAPLFDAASRFLGRWNTPLIIFFEAVAAATMTIAGGREPNAHRRKPDEPAEILGERDGHRGDAGRSGEEVLPAEQGGDGGPVHLSKVNEHATESPGMLAAKLGQ